MKANVIKTFNGSGMFLINFQFSTMASSVPERLAVDNGALRAIAFQSAWLTCSIHQLSFIVNG